MLRCVCMFHFTIHLHRSIVADAQRDDEMAENERTRQSRTSPQQKKSKSRRHIEQWTAQLNASKRSAPASTGRATKQAKKTATATRRKKTPSPTPLDDVAGPCTFAPFTPSPSGRGSQPKKSKKRAAESDPTPTAESRCAAPDSPTTRCQIGTTRRISKKARNDKAGLAKLNSKTK